MADVLKRVAGPVAIAAASTLVYTVPAATATAVRSIHVANETAAVASFTLSLGTDGAGKRFFYQFAVYPSDVMDWQGLLVITAGEMLYANATTANALTLTVSGIESS